MKKKSQGLEYNRISKDEIFTKSGGSIRPSEGAKNYSVIVHGNICAVTENIEDYKGIIGDNIPDSYKEGVSKTAIHITELIDKLNLPLGELVDYVFDRVDKTNGDEFKNLIDRIDGLREVISTKVDSDVNGYDVHVKNDPYKWIPYKPYILCGEGGLENIWQTPHKLGIHTHKTPIDFGNSGGFVHLNSSGDLPYKCNFGGTSCTKTSDNLEYGAVDSINYKKEEIGEYGFILKIENEGIVINFVTTNGFDKIRKQCDYCVSGIKLSDLDMIAKKVSQRYINHTISEETVSKMRQELVHQIQFFINNQ